MPACSLCRVYIHDYIEASLVQGFRKTYRRATGLVPAFAQEVWRDFAVLFEDDWLADCIAYRCKQLEKGEGRLAAAEYCIQKQRRLTDTFELWGVAFYERGFASEDVVSAWLSNMLYDLFMTLSHIHAEHGGPRVQRIIEMEWDEECMLQCLR